MKLNSLKLISNLCIVLAFMTIVGAFTFELSQMVQQSKHKPKAVNVK